MKILHISDTHSLHKSLTNLPDADIIIHTGDISDHGRKDEVESFIGWFSRLPYQYKIFIAGNHDISFENKPEWLVELLAEYTKYEYIHFYLENSGCEIEGIKIWGSPTTPLFETRFNAFMVDRGPQMWDLWNKIPDDTDIVLTHGPVWGKLDTVGTPHYQYVGCEQLLWHIKRVKPKLHLCGHVHKQCEWVYDENTTYINSALCGHGMINNIVGKPHLIEITDNKEINILEW